MTLLDAIALSMELDSLSDLHNLLPSEKSFLIEMLEPLPCDTYPLEEWTDALSYITGSKVSESSCAAEKEHLISFLKTNS